MRTVPYSLCSTVSFPEVLNAGRKSVWIVSFPSVFFKVFLSTLLLLLPILLLSQHSFHLHWSVCFSIWGVEIKCLKLPPPICVQLWIRQLQRRNECVCNYRAEREQEKKRRKTSAVSKMCVRLISFFLARTQIKKRSTPCYCQKNKQNSRKPFTWQYSVMKNTPTSK